MMERWVPECEADGRYKPLQCRPSVTPGGPKQCQCLSPLGDVLTKFPSNGYGNVVNCNCYFENFWYPNRARSEYNGMKFKGVSYGSNQKNGRPPMAANQVVGRNFYELGWMPERQPTCQPDGRYQVRRRCSSDGYCWCIDDYGMVRTERKRDRNIICP